ncbi:major facilitator superfamily domain-containing protein [Umbelopsis sp. PMI_123]|nr:major facilitator superfamily domain-containing protein [Umbelopsis sp. PMI_123]
MTEKQAAEEPHIDTTETIVSEKDSENALYANYPNVDEKKLLRKMDLIILPTLGFCQVFNFLDRINISNAKIAGLTTQLGLNNYQFGWVLSIFFFGYIICEIPSNIIMKKVRPSRWIPTIMVTWGVIVMSMAACTNYAGLLVCRFLLGCVESGMLCGILYYLSFWYKRSEMGKRTGAIVCAVTLAGAIGGLLATGIQYMDGALGHAAWQWIFIIEGIPSVCMGIIVFLFLPDFPGSKNASKYFTEEELNFLVERMRIDHTDAKDQKIHWRQVFEGVTDYKLWLYTFTFFSQSLPVYSFSFFLPTIIANMNISTSVAVTQALTVPVYFFGLFLVIIAAWSSDRFKDRLYHNIAAEIICIIGFIILLTSRNSGVLYFATMLGTLCFASAPALMAWNNDNVIGTTKSAFATGLMIMGGNLSGVAAGQIYKDAPYYFNSHMINFCLQVVSVILVLILRFALKRENRKLDERAAAGETLPNGSFRYRL